MLKQVKLKINNNLINSSRHITCVLILGIFPCLFLSQDLDNEPVCYLGIGLVDRGPQLTNLMSLFSEGISHHFLIKLVVGLKQCTQTEALKILSRVEMSQ